METPEGKRFNTVGPDSVSVGQGSRPISFHSRTKSLPPSPDSPPSLPCPGCAAPPSAGINQSTGRLRLHGSANVSVVLRLLGESVELRVLSDSSTMTIAMMSQVFIDVFLNSLELFFIYAALIFRFDKFAILDNLSMFSWIFFTILQIFFFVRVLLV